MKPDTMKDVFWQPVGYALILIAIGAALGVALHAAAVTF